MSDLGLPPSGGEPPLEGKKRTGMGLTLVVLGLVIFLIQAVRGPEESFFLPVIGAVFLWGYFSKRNFGYLVPGCILLGLTLGQLAHDADLPFRNPTSAGLGLGFVAIWVIDRFYRGENPWWALIPGGVLFFTGIASAYSDLGRRIAVSWPLLLVVIGVLLWLGVLGKKR
jgi:4-hydroxybenzoate polyprenyltransferase